MIAESCFLISLSVKLRFYLIKVMGSDDYPLVACSTTVRNISIQLLAGCSCTMATCYLINIQGVPSDVVCIHLINIVDRYPSIC